MSRIQKVTPEQLGFFKEEYNRAKRKKESNQHPQWRQIINEYRMNSYWDTFDSLFGPLVTGEDVANSAADIDETRLASVDGRLGALNVMCRKLQALIHVPDPDFAISNSRPEDEAIATVLERQFESTVKDIGLSDVAAEGLLEGILTGSAFFLTSYSSQFVPGEDPFPEIDKKLKREAKNGDMNQALADAQYPDMQTTEYSDPAVQVGKPVCVLIKSSDVFFDTGTKDLKTIRIIFIRFTRRVLDIHEDMRLDKEARKTVVGKWPEGQDVMYSDETEFAGHCKMADQIMALDLASKSYMIFSPDVEKALRDWTAFPFKVDNPLKIWQPVPDPRGPWGIPLAYLILRQAKALNYLKANKMDKIGRDGKKIMVTPANVSDDFISRVNTAPDGTWLKADGVDEANWANWCKEFSFGQYNPELLRMETEFFNDMNFMYGFDAPTAGLPAPGSRTTATETAARQQQTSVPIQFMRDKFDTVMEQIAKDLCLIMLQFNDPNDVIKVVGNDPEVYMWVSYDRARITSDFNLKIRVGAGTRMDKTTYRSQFNDLMQRVQEYAQLAHQDMITQMQGAPPSPVDYMEAIRIMVDEFDPRLSDRILLRQDPMRLYQRLLGQDGVSITQVSPQLQANIQKVAQGAMAPQGGTPNSPPAPGQMPEVLNPGAGPLMPPTTKPMAPSPNGSKPGTSPLIGPAQTPANSNPGFISGRAHSEAR